MKLLLTSGGITNASLHRALTEMLGKPISESSALCIPTAAHAQKNGPEMNYKFVTGYFEKNAMVSLGWKSMGILELTALNSINQENWKDTVRATDVLLVNGGDPMYLYHWVQQSGLASLFPELANTVYVGLSAGSMIMTPQIGEDFVKWNTPEGTDRTLGLVDFAIFPHLDHPMLPDNIMETATPWANKLDCHSYAIDDETGIAVVEGDVKVISEGTWHYFAK